MLLTINNADSAQAIASFKRAVTLGEHNFEVNFRYANFLRKSDVNTHVCFV